MKLGKVYFGFPIPLQCITPNLQFYPLVFPTECIIMKNTLIENNYCFLNDNNANVPLSAQDHMIFIETLMKYLEREYIIANNYLIDLKRKDYQITVNRNTNEIYISQYHSKNTIIYVDEKYITNKIKFDPIDTSLQYIESNNNNNNNITENNWRFILSQCKRIMSNTRKINHFMNKSFFSSAI